MDVDVRSNQSRMDGRYHDGPRVEHGIVRLACKLVLSLLIIRCLQWKNPEHPEWSRWSVSHLAHGWRTCPRSHCQVHSSRLRMKKACCKTTDVSSGHSQKKVNMTHWSKKLLSKRYDTLLLVKYLQAKELFTYDVDWMVNGTLTFPIENLWPSTVQTETPQSSGFDLMSWGMYEAFFEIERLK